MQLSDFNRDTIIALVRQVQYLYGLKYEIRYGHTRTELHTESVAEHIYALHILSQIFLALEDPKQTWDHNKVRQLITWHDVDEIETGDIIGWKKTDADREREKEASVAIIDKLPIVIQNEVAALLHEYGAQESIEAQFVKAIDKIEPLFHLYNEQGKAIAHDIGLTFEASNRIKEPYVKQFPYVKLFSEGIQKFMIEEGFFVG